VCVQGVPECVYVCVQSVPECVSMCVQSVPECVYVCVQSVPEVNVVWSGETPRRHDNIDICVAVATDNGLITPIVKNAIGLGVKEISDVVKVAYDSVCVVDT